MVAHDHEIVSIFGHSEEQIEQLMTCAPECVLMWATKDGWPVGVVHAYVWHEGRKWLTFDADKSARDMAGALPDEEKTPMLSADAERMNKEREARGLAPR